MSRLGQRRTRASAAKRLLRGEAHGMQVRLDEECLSLAATSGLERLAEFLGIAGPGIRIRQQHETERQWRRTLIYAVLQEERRLARCPRERRWDLPRDRV